MKDLKLLQIVPSLESGGVEQGTVDVANYIASKGLDSFIASNGGNMLQQINRKRVRHITLPLYSKNIFTILESYGFSPDPSVPESCRRLGSI